LLEGADTQKRGYHKTHDGIAKQN